MAGNDDEHQSFSARVSAIEGEVTTIKSVLDRMAQAIERISLNIDDRGLADGTYRSGQDRSSGNPHTQPPPQHFLLQ